MNAGLGELTRGRRFRMQFKEQGAKDVKATVGVVERALQRSNAEVRPKRRFA